jgi:hypothetical protein
MVRELTRARVLVLPRRVTLRRMKPDTYTKAVLTVIALTLTVIACNQYIEPKATAQAQASPFAGVQYSGTNGALLLRSPDWRNLFLS